MSGDMLPWGEPVMVLASVVAVDVASVSPHATGFSCHLLSLRKERSKTVYCSGEPTPF